MLPAPRIEAALFEVGAGETYSLEGVQALLDGLTAINRAWLRHHKAPQLYASGVRYKRERGKEAWQAIPAVLRAGSGDCEDLASWRAAELQDRGERARAVLVKVRPRQLHVMVRRQNGRLEDPSRRLGMKGPA